MTFMTTNMNFEFGNELPYFSSALLLLEADGTHMAQPAMDLPVIKSEG